MTKQHLDFSELANQMAVLNALIFDTPASQHAKIQLIKDEISADTYQINDCHIAAKLVEFSPAMKEMESA